MSDTAENKPWMPPWIAKMIGYCPPERWLVIGFATGLTGFLWYRDYSKPPVLERSRSNPASAAANFDPSSEEASQQTLADRYNLAWQQLISARAQQIKADIAREGNDKTNRCYRKNPTLCAEIKLQDLAQRQLDAIDSDGSLKVSPARALQINAEGIAILAALRGLGVRDANTERLAQIYLSATGGEYSTLSGVAASVKGTNEYLDTISKLQKA